MKQKNKTNEENNKRKNEEIHPSHTPKNQILCHLDKNHDNRHCNADNVPCIPTMNQQSLLTKSFHLTCPKDSQHSNESDSNIDCAATRTLVMKTDRTSLRCERRVVHITATAAFPPSRTLARCAGSCIMTRCDAVKWP